MFLLLILLLIVHFLCDFTVLSTKSMLIAKSIGKPLYPIVMHGFTHAMFMTIVVAFFDFAILSKVYAIEFISHTAIDTLKGKCNVWFPAVKNPALRWHWFLFGFDQLLHYIVIIIIVSMVKF